jgi:hypothetical protein
MYVFIHTVISPVMSRLWQEFGSVRCNSLNLPGKSDVLFVIDGNMAIPILRNDF